jgi:hypothetical protein
MTATELPTAVRDIELTVVASVRVTPPRVIPIATNTLRRPVPGGGNLPQSLCLREGLVKRVIHRSPIGAQHRGVVGRRVVLFTLVALSAIATETSAILGQRREPSGLRQRRPQRQLTWHGRAAAQRYRSGGHD